MFGKKKRKLTLHQRIDSLRARSWNEFIEHDRAIAEAILEAAQNGPITLGPEYSPTLLNALRICIAESYEREDEAYRLEFELFGEENQ